MTIDRQELGSDHAELTELAVRLRMVIYQITPDFEELTRARWKLGYRLAVHLAKEDKFVYPHLKKHSDPRIATLAAQFEDEMGDLDQQFRDYMARWPTNEIRNRWNDFAAETAKLLSVLDHRIAREEKQLYPLLSDDRVAGRPDR